MRTCLTFILFTFIAACSSPQSTPPPQPVVERANMAFWTTEDKKLDVIQQVVGSWEEERFSMQARIALREDRLKLVMLDNLGRRAMMAEWDETGISTWKASWLPDYFDAEYMMWDIVTSFWPVESLNEIYGEDWTIEDIGNLRKVTYQGEDVAYVTYRPLGGSSLWNSLVHYENLYYGYQLDIQSREVQP